MFERLQAMFRSRPPSMANRSSGFNQSLPQHGILYFDLLDAKLRSKPPQSIKPELEPVIEEIHKKRQENALTWNDLYTFDLILARSLQPAQLAREVWSLRSRYRDVVGLHEYEAYLASKPPDLTGQGQDDALRADIEYLLGQIYLRYAIAPINQVVSDRISRRVTLVILCWVALIVIAVMQKSIGIDQSSPFTLLAVLFVGAMGGLLSMQQRYQSVPREGDPIDNISELMQNWSRLFLPAISGGIFAVLLYMLFIGQLVQGDLFPRMIPGLGDENKTQGTAFWDLLANSRPLSGRDYAKLIIWSFIAGFAERYVPDTLAHFISRRETEIRTPRE
jgi:hypothetical protein